MRLVVQLEIGGHPGRHPATTVALLVDENDKVVARGELVASEVGPVSEFGGPVVTALHFEGEAVQ